jgi:hypothetical protein
LDVDTKTVDVDKILLTMHEVFDDLPKNFEKLFGVKFNVVMACETQVGNNWEDMEVVARP